MKIELRVMSTLTRSVSVEAGWQTGLRSWSPDRELCDELAIFYPYKMENDFHDFTILKAGATASVQYLTNYCLL